MCRIHQTKCPDEAREEHKVILQLLVSAVEVEPDSGGRTCLEAEGCVQLPVGGIHLCRQLSIGVDGLQPPEVVRPLSSFGLRIEGVAVGEGVFGRYVSGHAQLLPEADGRVDMCPEADLPVVVLNQVIRIEVQCVEVSESGTTVVKRIVHHESYADEPISREVARNLRFGADDGLSRTVEAVVVLPLVEQQADPCAEAKLSVVRRLHAEVHIARGKLLLTCHGAG